MIFLKTLRGARPFRRVFAHPGQFRKLVRLVASGTVSSTARARHLPRSRRHGSWSRRCKRTCPTGAQFAYNRELQRGEEALKGSVDVACQPCPRADAGSARARLLVEELRYWERDACGVSRERVVSPEGRGAHKKARRRWRAVWRSMRRMIRRLYPGCATFDKVHTVVSKPARIRPQSRKSVRYRRSLTGFVRR
jgi:hypothetical protein